MTGKQYRSEMCTFEAVNRYPGKSLETTDRQGRIFQDAAIEYDEEAAVQAARRCLVFHNCTSCDLCRYLCPDLCITRNPDNGLIEIDYNYCKGCGICAFICPKGAIGMVREE